MNIPGSSNNKAKLFGNKNKIVKHLMAHYYVLTTDSDNSDL